MVDRRDNGYHKHPLIFIHSFFLSFLLSFNCELVCSLCSEEVEAPRSIGLDELTAIFSFQSLRADEKQGVRNASLAYSTIMRNMAIPALLTRLCFTGEVPTERSDRVCLDQTWFGSMSATGR